MPRFVIVKLGLVIMLAQVAACSSNHDLECPGGQLDCGGTCVDTNNDPAHCGSCDNACSPDEVCNEGSCGVCADGDTRPCGSDEGECVAGVETCTAGAWGGCVGEVGPSPEACDNLDNNCDGATDEGLTRACGTDEGECVAGVETCTAGAWGGCVGQVGPSPEACDNLDNNCDGQTDEGLTRPCGTDEGECVAGVETCTAGAWGSCVGEVGPSPEVCADGLDNNCNGWTDDDEPDADGDTAPPCRGGVVYDCDDQDPDRSPHHLEVAGNGIDDNCDGNQDDPPPQCDTCSGSLADALDVCSPWVAGYSTDGSSEGWGWRQLLASSPIGPRNGCSMLVISSGHIDADTGYGFGADYVQPGYDLNPNGSGQDIILGNIGGNAIEDQVRVYLELDVPANANSFSFDFVFLSAEYPEWTCTDYNDRFYAVVQSGHPDYAGYSCLGQAPAPREPGQGCRNISFDGNGNEISVNASFLEDARDGSTWSAQNLGGTGYLDPCLTAYVNCVLCQGTDGDPPGCTMPNNCNAAARGNNSIVGSSTAWLTTTANVLPGEKIRLIFTIYDMSDEYWDSRVIIDNFLWSTDPVAGPVTTK